MMKTVKQCLAILSLSALTSMSFAASSGSYLGLGLGGSKLNTSKPNVTAAGSSSLSNSGFAGRVFGGYNFNQYVGLEAGLADYSQSKYTFSAPGLSASQKYSLYALDLVAKGYLPLSDTGFNVYALGGAAYVKSKLKFAQSGGKVLTNYTGSGSATTNALRPIYGLGVGYDFAQTGVSTTLEATRIQGTGNLKTSTKAIPNANLLTLNLAYNFG